MNYVGELYIERKNIDLLLRNTIIVYEICCIRIVVFIIEQMFEEAGQYLEKNAKILLTHNEVPALLYEQSAYVNLRKNPQMIRKFVHRLFLAGEIYYHQGILTNTVYCFGVCHILFSDKYWAGILSRIYTILIDCFTKLDDLINTFKIHKKYFELSIKIEPEKNHNEIYTKFLNSSVKLSHYINDPQSKLDDTKKKESINEFDIPCLLSIKTETFDLRSTADEFYTNCLDASNLKQGDINGLYNESQSWLSLGRMLDEDTFKSNLKESPKKRMIKSREESLRDLVFYDEIIPINKIPLYFRRERLVHLPEPIELRFRIKNPLNITIEISQMKLLCHYVAIFDSESPQYVLTPISFTLSPLETKEVTLSVIPKECGKFSIDGVYWKIADVIYGSCLFSKTLIKKKPIIILVKGKSSKLSIINNEKLKCIYYNGEIQNYSFILKNTGEYPIEDITLQTDYPIFIGWKKLVLDWKLKPNEERTFKITFRMIELNSHNSLKNIKILIRYSSFTDEDKVKFTRYSRIQYVFNILPSFDINFKFAASQKTFDDYILNLTAVNFATRFKYFDLSDLYVMNQGWEISLKENTNDFLNVLAILKRSNKSECNYISLKNEQTDVKRITSHINEYNEASRVSLDTSVDVIVAWTMKIQKSIIYGAHNLTISLHQNCLENYEHIFPLNVIASYSEIVKHDYTIEPYLYT